MSDFATAHGVTPIVFPGMSREISIADALTIWKTYRLFVRLQPDVIHTHTAKAGTVGRVAGLLYRYLTPLTLIGRPRRCRCIHTFHGHIFHSYYGALKTRLFLTIERILARIATDRIVVLAAQQKHEIQEVFRIGRPEQFAIVPLGIDLEFLNARRDHREELRRELGAAPSDKVVGIVGRLTAIKNHDLFLRVAAHFPTGVRFAVFGDGSDRPALQKRAAELHVTDRVCFAGVREPSAIYAAVDVVALTSLNEGTPLALIEAMANGIPVVSTAVGGVVDLLGPIRESVESREGSYDLRERGVATATNDENAFAAALARIIGDKELASAMAQRARDFAVKNYSKERLIADIIRLTRDLTS